MKSNIYWKIFDDEKGCELHCINTAEGKEPVLNRESLSKAVVPEGMHRKEEIKQEWRDEMIWLGAEDGELK